MQIGILVDVCRLWTHTLTNKPEWRRAMNCPNCMNPVEESMREAFVEIREWDGQAFYGEKGHGDIYDCNYCNCTFYVDWQGKEAAFEADPPTDMMK